jgi:hypothetical protein
MRADQHVLLRERRESVPAPLWHEDLRADSLYMVFRFGSAETATVFAMTWGNECGGVLQERLDDWDESRALRELE